MKQTLLLALLATPTLLDPLRAQLTVDDELERVELSQPALSPDGERILFVRAELNWEENRRDRSLHMIPSAGGESIPFTSGPDDESPAWSPDGAWIAFLRKTEPAAYEDPGVVKGKPKKHKQIWAMRSNGGEAFQLTDLADGVEELAWSPTGGGIVFSAEDPRTKEEKESLEKGEDAILVYEGPNGQGRARWSNLWWVDLERHEPRQITHEQMLVSDFAVSPDGTQVAFVYRRENSRNNLNLAEVGVAAIADGRLERVTENRTPESKVRWRPDGGALTVLAPDAQEWELAQRKLFAVDLETGRLELLSGALDGAISEYRLTSDGEAILLLAARRTTAGLYRLDPASGRTTPLLTEPGVAAEVSFSAEGNRAAYVWSTATEPHELYQSSLEPGASPTRLTDLNPELRTRQLAEVKLVHWRSRDGLEVEGLLYLPAGSEQRHPLILEIHGGPAGAFTSSWRGDRHVYATLGYALLCPNVRGSAGYGDPFLRGNLKDIGGGDYEDLMSGVDHLIAAGIADPERLALRGWSYGGILGGTTVTKTGRFKAASLGAMVSDWTSEYGQGFNYDVRRWYIGGDPWTNRERYLELSPLTHADRVSTPTLLLHGEEDTTCTVEQSANFFNALWERGVKTRFIRFPREEHGLREPRHQRLRLSAEIAWMEEHVRGRAWEDERRPELESPSDEEETR